MECTQQQSRVLALASRFMRVQACIELPSMSLGEAASGLCRQQDCV